MQARLGKSSEIIRARPENEKSGLEKESPEWESLTIAD